MIPASEIGNPLPAKCSTLLARMSVLARLIERTAPHEPRRRMLERLLRLMQLFSRMSERLEIAAPETPAITMARTIAMPITSVSPSDWLQMKTPTIVVVATAAPFKMPTPASFTMRRGQWERRTSRSASPRIVTASACMPLFPDWPATTGRRIASAVNLAIVPSKSPTVNAARKAVARLISSQGSR